MADVPESKAPECEAPESKVHESQVHESKVQESKVQEYKVQEYKVHECGVCLEIIEDACIFDIEGLVIPEDFVVGGISVKMGCGHVGHATCIDKWRQMEDTESGQRNGCPLCRHGSVAPKETTRAELEQFIGPGIRDQGPVPSICMCPDCIARDMRRMYMIFGRLPILINRNEVMTDEEMARRLQCEEYQ
jgi:hypothetical protein